MKFKNPLFVVEDIEKSVAFYKRILGLRVIADFGANVTLTGGVALQTKESWCSFIHKSGDEICFYSNAGELYFEEENFAAWWDKFSQDDTIHWVHPMVEHRWGQRVARFYDLDGHIIEVGEPMRAVINRFAVSGMEAEDIACRMDIPLKMVNRYLQAE